MPRRLLCIPLAFNSNSQDKIGYAAVTKQNNILSGFTHQKVYLSLKQNKLQVQVTLQDNHPPHGASAIHAALIYEAKLSQHEGVFMIRKTEEKRNRRIAYTSLMLMFH